MNDYLKKRKRRLEIHASTQAPKVNVDIFVGAATVHIEHITRVFSTGEKGLIAVLKAATENGVSTVVLFLVVEKLGLGVPFDGADAPDYAQATVDWQATQQ